MPGKARSRFLYGGIFAVALMPAPLRLTMGQGELLIDRSFSVSLAGAADPRLQASADRLMAHIAKRTGMPLSPDANSPRLAIFCQNAGKAVQDPGENESYKLSITPEKGELTAANPLGVIRGLATFEQLISSTASGFTVPALIIEDAPRFPWRGLHLDVSRHWMPVYVVKRNLDAMTAVKLNVFHWHLSDNQGFRVESKKYPKLQGLGSDGLFYTQEQVQDVIACARDRGIRVVPEFDVPGHATSWLVGYPELAAASGPFEIGRKWGVFDPVIDPTTEYTYKFLDTFIGEMARLFPDEYFHIGGDEVNGKEWDRSGRIAAFKQQHGFTSNDQLQAYFNQRILAIVKKHGKKMMGWDEILAPELPKDIVIQSWRGQKSLADAVQQGFQGILSSGYYLDHMDSAATHYAVDPLVDPKTRQPLDLTPEQQSRILGGEVCMWSEYVSAENVDSRIWPRTAAIAERFWSPAGVNDPKDMYARLGVVSEQLEWYGLSHRGSYGLMLERLAGGQPVEPVRILADVVKPVGLGGRARARQYTQQTPLNRLVDTARPESEAALRFDALVDAQDWAAARAMLITWKDNAPRLAPLLQNSLLQEAAPVSNNLTRAATIGLEALNYIGSGTRPSQTWALGAVATLAELKKPKAEVILAITGSVERLIGVSIIGAPTK